MSSPLPPQVPCSDRRSPAQVDNAPCAPRRKRPGMFTKNQKAYLETYFSQNAYPKGPEVAGIEDDLRAISPSMNELPKVTRWFEHRRARARKEQQNNIPQLAPAPDALCAPPARTETAQKATPKVAPSIDSATVPRIPSLAKVLSSSPPEPMSEEAFLFHAFPPQTFIVLRAFYRNNPDADDSTVLKWASLLNLRIDQVQFYVRWKQLQARKALSKVAERVTTPPPDESFEHSVGKESESQEAAAASLLPTPFATPSMHSSPSPQSEIESQSPHNIPLEDTKEMVPCSDQQDPVRRSPTPDLSDLRFPSVHESDRRPLGRWKTVCVPCSVDIHIQVRE